ncbi:MAG TPA: Npt1/Npt2 family nucleotide transporter [Vicinamibacteria bacterium]|nr:Npt1/Npt2 family nucleotide transporter [Vicinamibacteria bacterium]
MTRLVGRLLRLQPGDLTRGGLLFAYLLLVLCAYVVGQVARDALFLGRFAASRLPFADMTLFAVVAAVAAVYVRVGRRLGLERVLVGSLVGFGLLGLGFALLAHRGAPAWLYPVVYVWVGVFGVLAPAQVWTLANYVLTPREARRLFGIVGAGATLGAALGGFLSNATARRFGAESLLLLMSAVILGSTPLVGPLWRRRHQLDAAPPADEQDPGLPTSLDLILDSGHLRAIAGIVLLSSFVTALSGWQLKAIAQQSIPGTNALAQFFGAWNGSVGVACLAIQLLATAGILRRLGLGQVLLLLPLGLLAGSLGLLAFGTLTAAVALRSVDKVLRYSLDRPAVELLYLPVPPPSKLVAKSFIDTVVWRAGDGLAGLSVLLFATIGGLGAVRLSLLNIPLLLLWVALALRVHRRYVSTLEQTLQQHRLDAERADTPLLDRDTTERLASRLSGKDAEEILYALDLVALGEATAVHPAVRGLLAHPAPSVRRRALSILGEAGDRSALKRVEELLADGDLEVRTEALLYLARHADADPVARVHDFRDFPDYSVRAALVAVLTRLGGERLETAQAVFALMAAEAGEEGRRTRLEAARLAERMALPFEDALRALIADEADEVAAAAIRAASRHGALPYVGVLVRRLAAPALVDAASEALATAGAAAVEALAAELADTQAPPPARRAAATVLAKVGGRPAAAALSGHLLVADAALRLRVVTALCEIQDQDRSVPLDEVALEAALGAEILGHYRSYQILDRIQSADPDHAPIVSGLRTAMTEELERMFDLLHLMHPDRDFRSTWVALQSGDRVIHDQALDLLETLLKPGLRTLLVPLVDPEVTEPERRRLAERLIGPALDAPEAAVQALIGTGDPWLRSCAAYAIGALGLRSLEPQLAAWEGDPDPLLRETVRQARSRLAAPGEAVAVPAVGAARAAAGGASGPTSGRRSP